MFTCHPPVYHINKFFLKKKTLLFPSIFRWFDKKTKNKELKKSEKLNEELKRLFFKLKDF